MARKKKHGDQDEQQRSGPFTRDELDAVSGDVLPERTAMSVIGNLTRVDAGLSAAVTPEDDPAQYGGPDEATDDVP
jgi:hypothetical protein